MMMATKEGTLNMASHRSRGGMVELKTTKFAGLEMGSTKLAAFATSAHEKRYGSGGALARLTAVNTAGVRTTAVASLDMKTVTSTPTAKIRVNSLADDPFADLTAK